MFAFLLLKSLFGLLLSLFKSLRIARGIICRLEVLGLCFRLFDSRVFYDSALSLYLGYSDVSGTISLLCLVVYLSNIRSRLEIYFDLSLERFLDHIFSGIQYLTLLFHLGFYGRLKIFLEEFNKVGLF